MKKPSRPRKICYHRLLTPGENDEIKFVDAFLKTNSLAALYDTVFIPAISTAETDARLELLDPDQLLVVQQSLRDIVQDLSTRPAVPAKSAGAEAREGAEVVSTPVAAPLLPCRVYCVPARADRDELAGSMLTHLLQLDGHEAWSAPGKLVAGELLGLVEKADADVICISVVAPSTVIHARYLCLKMRAKFPRAKIIVGLWGLTEGLDEASGRLRESGADEVVSSLAEAVVRINRIAPFVSEPMTPAALPADDEERLDALHSLRLMDTAAEPIFDRITTRLARIFEVPIVLLTLVDRDRQFFKSQIGLPEDLANARQAPRDVSVCGHVVANREVLVVEDLARDRRFANNPWLKQRGMRFYAGTPLLAPGGQPVGALCLLDRKPRQFSEQERRQLQAYADDVMEEFARRAVRLEAAAAAAAATAN